MDFAPWNLLFMDFIIPNHVKQYKKFMETCLKHIIFVNTYITNFESVEGPRTIFKFVECIISKLYEDEDREMINVPYLFLQKFGYEFHIYQKHEMEIWYYVLCRKPKSFSNPLNFSSFKEGNHQILISR